MFVRHRKPAPILAALGFAADSADADANGLDLCDSLVRQQQRHRSPHLSGCLQIRHPIPAGSDG